MKVSIESNKLNEYQLFIFKERNIVNADTYFWQAMISFQFLPKFNTS